MLVNLTEKEGNVQNIQVLEEKKQEEEQFYSAENESDESLPNLAAREHFWDVETRAAHPAL